MGLLPVLCAWGLHRRRHPKGRVHGSRHKRLVPLPTAVNGGPEERATFCRVSCLVPSRMQEQVSELENLLREGLGKGGNGVPGDPTGRWQWLQQGKLSPKDHSSLELGRSEPISMGLCQRKSQQRTLVAGCHILGAAERGWALAVVWEAQLGDSPCQGRYRVSQGRCVRSFVLLTDCQAAFQIWLSLPGRFNTSWLCAP